MKRVTKSVRRARTIAVDDSSALPEDECDISVLTETFGFLIRVCQLQAFRGFYEALGDTGLTPGSYATLELLGANPGIRQGFVASLLGFREPNMARLVKELSSSGLITRKPLPHDRRASGLELTIEGREFLDSIQHRVEKLERGYTQGLTTMERKTLMTLLKKVFRQDQYFDGSIRFHDQ